MTAREEVFCREYLIDLNQTQAAIRAGYSPRSAREQGARLMARAHVRACIDRRMAERSRRAELSAERVVQELARIAFFNAADAVDLDEAKVRAGACGDDTAAIASVKCKTTTTDGKSTSRETVEREIKFVDKLKALELLGRHLGMFDRDRGAEREERAGGVILLPEIAEEEDTDGDEPAQDPESGDRDG